MVVSFQNRVKLARRVFNKTAFFFNIKITNSERKKKK